MARAIAVCCDGTWNVPDEERAGVGAATNVAKLALGIESGEGTNQLLFYEPGVGTDVDDRIIGGAFGYGLSQNVRSPYRYLAEQYQPGDDIYLFGFSRGAYTARSLAGLIRNCGILQPQHVDQVDAAFAFYRDRTSHTHPSSLASQLFRQMYSHADADIHFIGVWDTVGALGIPSDLPGWEELSRRLHGWQELWGFHDTQLSSHVRNAYHALAIDEQREPFQPTLWTQDQPTAGQTVEQVWFSGVHTEVGGGSRDPSLSDIALLWLVGRAQACGLAVEPGQLALGSPSGNGGVIAPNYAGEIHDSRKGMYKALHAYHRLIKLPFNGAPGQSISSSAARRFREGVGRYSPDGLATYLDHLSITDVTEVTSR